MNEHRAMNTLSALCSAVENALLLPEKDAARWLQQSRIREVLKEGAADMRVFVAVHGGNHASKQ